MQSVAQHGSPSCKQPPCELPTQAEDSDGGLLEGGVAMLCNPEQLPHLQCSSPLWPPTSTITLPVLLPPLHPPLPLSHSPCCYPLGPFSCPAHPVHSLASLAANTCWEGNCLLPCSPPPIHILHNLCLVCWITINLQRCHPPSLASIPPLLVPLFTSMSCTISV